MTLLYCVSYVIFVFRGLGFFFVVFVFLLLLLFFWGGIYFQLCIKLKSFGEFDRCILVRLKVHKKNMLLE